MKKFEIFRYLKKFRFLILILALAASAFIYSYTNKKQQYIATTVIQFTNSGAENGTTPSGAPIEVDEIFSASVISNVISDLNLRTNVDDIRSRCTVTEIIPEEETTRKEALLKEGEEYEYFPTTYQVSFTAPSSSNAAYAWDVLDSIISNYFEFYSRRYVEVSVIPNNIENVDTGKYDYLDCVEIMDDSINDISTYLSARSSSHPDFRSARTGYTFSDLADEYTYISDTLIPNLYAEIYSNRLVSNQDGLLRRYENKVNENEINIANLTAEINELRALTTKYSDKLINDDADKGKYNFSDESNLIIGDIEDYDRQGTENHQTTYDELINRFISLSSEKIKVEEKLAHNQEIVDTFSMKGIVNDTSSDTAADVTEQIKYISSKLDEMYAQVTNTVEEFNEVVGAENISTLSSIISKQKINVKLYISLSLVLFLVLGCAGAVILGRLEDFINYYMYTNKVTKLPNRAKCNLMIDDLSAKALPESFSCVVMRLQTLRKLNDEASRSSGDFALMAFGKILKESAEGYGFVGYNDGDNFLCLFENCSKSKAKTFIDLVGRGVENLNSYEERDFIKFISGVATSSDDDIYQIRKLLSAAFADMNNNMKKS